MKRVQTSQHIDCTLAHGQIELSIQLRSSRTLHTNKFANDLCTYNKEFGMESKSKNLRSSLPVEPTRLFNLVSIDLIWRPIYSLDNCSCSDLFCSCFSLYQIFTCFLTSLEPAEPHLGRYFSSSLARSRRRGHKRDLCHGWHFGGNSKTHRIDRNCVNEHTLS